MTIKILQNLRIISFNLNERQYNINKYIKKNKKNI